MAFRYGHEKGPLPDPEGPRRLAASLRYIAELALKCAVTCENLADLPSVSEDEIRLFTVLCNRMLTAIKALSKLEAVYFRGKPTKGPPPDEPNC